MIVKAKVYIRHNGVKHSPEEKFSIKEEELERIKDVVEVIEGEKEVKEDKKAEDGKKVKEEKGKKKG